MAERCSCGEAARRLASSLRWLIEVSERERHMETIEATGAVWGRSWDTERACALDMSSVRDHLREISPAVGRDDWRTAKAEARGADAEARKLLEECPSPPCKCGLTALEFAGLILATRREAAERDKEGYMEAADKALETLGEVERKCGIFVDPARRTLHAGVDMADRESFDSADRLARDSNRALGRAFRACTRIIEIVAKYVGGK